ncbi:hypothetical protein JKF63_02528 [Porcisia hertigi]|uniref:Uncharacterized protein n=1 Tax=Porcisia hertigi TaxID=2761500 RepID=A0A836H9P0_9TRYP|nr:hypothetical protein JKF63_02528 [Porcisia hertigi]
MSRPFQSISGSTPVTPTDSRLLQRGETNVLIDSTLARRPTVCCTSFTKACAGTHHSRGSSSAESRDYVDEIASSAFQNCRSAALAPVGCAALQLGTCQDAVSSKAMETGAGSPGMAESRSFCIEGEYQRNGDSVNVHGLDRHIVDNSELIDAVNGAVAEGETTIEVFVPFTDDAAPVELEGQEDIERSMSASHDSVEAGSNAPFDPSVGVWGAVTTERTQCARKRPPLTHGNVSADRATLGVASAAAPSSMSTRHADSAEWAATRTTALEKLRAKFNYRSQSVDSAAPSRRSATRFARHALENVQVRCSPSETVMGRAHDLQGSESFEGRSKPPLPVPKTAATILDELIGDSWISRNGSASGQSSPQKTQVTAGDITEGDGRALLSETIHTPTRTTACSAEFSVIGRSVNGSRFVLRPALSTDVSGISPIKNDASSLLADLYNTLDIKPQTETPTQAHPRSLTTTTPAVGGHRRRTSQAAWETMQELSPDKATEDFCTAQSAPSTTFDSMEKTPINARVVPDTTTHKSLLNHASPLSERVGRSGVVSAFIDGRDADSGLRADPSVSMVQQTRQSPRDSSQVGRRRPSDHQAPPHTDRSAAEASVATRSHDSTTLTRAAERRQQSVKQEMEAKEMAECTFHPLLSPGTRAMVRLVQQRELERTLQEEEKAVASNMDGTHTTVTPTKSSSSPPLDPSTLRATLHTVYDRLYPAELSAAASRRQLLDQEMEYRRLAREELILLRSHCGAASFVPHRSRGGGGAVRTRDTFHSFMCTFLQTDWEEEATVAKVTLEPVAASSSHTQHRVPGGDVTRLAVVQTSYRSPMAVALLEEQRAKRKYHSRRDAQMHGQHGDDTKEDAVGGTEESFRVALFDEFLLRQNAYYLNRARTVRELERKITPAFTPTTTDASTRLVQKMVSRSLLNETMGPETSSIVAQREQKRIPFTSSFVKQHRSPYVNPCTFHPNISPAARAAKEEERRLNGAIDQTVSQQRSSVFERLHMEQKRRLKRREDAKKRAEVEEVEGLTFRPAVNAKCNVGVQSMLSPHNYDSYQAFLNEKRLLMESKRRQQQEEVQQAEVDKCTFRPQITKKPAYVSKMARSFGVLRQQDTEF